MQEFKDMLKYFRLREGLSQLELAEQIGCSKSTIAMYESGQRKPSFETEEALADFFNVSLNLLRGRSDEQTDLYYLNGKTAEAAQFLFDNPEYQVLFDASKKVKPEDIAFIADLIDRMSHK